MNAEVVTCFWNIFQAISTIKLEYAKLLARCIYTVWPFKHKMYIFSLSIKIINLFELPVNLMAVEFAYAV